MMMMIRVVMMMMMMAISSENKEKVSHLQGENLPFLFLGKELKEKMLKIKNLNLF